MAEKEARLRGNGAETATKKGSTVKKLPSHAPDAATLAGFSSGHAEGAIFPQASP